MNAKVTPESLSKYELARILGTRAQQISNNAPVYIETSNLTDPLKIAIKEMKMGKTPMAILRKLPNGSVEKWKIEDLIFSSCLHA